MTLNYVTLVLDLYDGQGNPGRHRFGGFHPVGAADRCGRGGDPQMFDRKVAFR